MAIFSIYTIPTIINLTTDSNSDGSNVALMNFSANNTDIQIFSNVRNQIQAIIRDIDRKVATVDPTASVIMMIYDPDTGYVLFQQPMTCSSAAQGLWAVAIDRTSLPDWSKADYQFSIFVENATGTRFPLFTERSTGKSHGIIRVMDGPIPPPRQPMIVPSCDFILRDGASYSGAYAGAATVNNQSGQATFSAYLTNFSGTIRVQGSLDMNISTDDSQWFDVNTQTISLPQTGTIGQPFTGNFTYVRFVVNAASGSVDQIIYTV